MPADPAPADPAAVPDPGRRADPADAGVAPDRAAARRPLLVALTACAAGAGLALAAAQPTWLRITVPRTRPLADTTVPIPGHTLIPLVPALAIVGLTAVVGLLAVRGRVRTVVAAVVALAGLALLVAALAHVGAPSPSRTAELLTDQGPLPGRDPTRPVTAGPVPAWPLLTALGALALAAAGTRTALYGSRWTALSTRYDAAAARATPATAPTPTTATLWDALDRGDDPTA